MRVWGHPGAKEGQSPARPTLGSVQKSLARTAGEMWQSQARPREDGDLAFLHLAFTWASRMASFWHLAAQERRGLGTGESPNPQPHSVPFLGVTAQASHVWAGGTNKDVVPHPKPP